MSQSNRKYSTYRNAAAASRRAAYEREAIASIAAMFFQPTPVPPPANIPAAPARMLINPQQGGETILDRARRHADLPRLGINCLARCEWTGSCRPAGNGCCQDCGLTIWEVR